MVTVCCTGACGRAAVQQADGAPDLVVVEPVQVVAAGDARLAARAGVEVDLEGVLLARLRLRQRNRIAVAMRAVAVRQAGVVRAGESLDRGQPLLLGEHQLERRYRRDRTLHRRELEKGATNHAFDTRRNDVSGTRELSKQSVKATRDSAATRRPGRYAGARDGKPQRWRSRLRRSGAPRAHIAPQPAAGRALDNLASSRGLSLWVADTVRAVARRRAADPDQRAGGAHPEPDRRPARVAVRGRRRRRAGNPQAETRISLLGRFARVSAGDEADARARYTARLPRAAANSQTRDFQLWEMTVEEVRLVAGFGQIGWLPGSAVVGKSGGLDRQTQRRKVRISPLSKAGLSACSAAAG